MAVSAAGAPHASTVSCMKFDFTGALSSLICAHGVSKRRLKEVTTCRK